MSKEKDKVGEAGRDKEGREFIIHVECFNFNFLSWASSRYLEFNHPKSGSHRSHEPVLGSHLSFILSLRPPYHPAWVLSLWLGSLTSPSLPPSLSPLFTRSSACNRRPAKVSWVDKQMNESFVTSRFFPQTSKKGHRSRNDPGKSPTWLSDYVLDFKIHRFCTPPVSASCYFVPTTSHHFLWACSWLESVGSSSVLSAVAEVTHEAVLTWKLGWDILAVFWPLSPWGHSSLSDCVHQPGRWIQEEAFQRRSPSVHVLIKTWRRHLCCCSIGLNSACGQVQSQHKGLSTRGPVTV